MEFHRTSVRVYCHGKPYSLLRWCYGLHVLCTTSRKENGKAESEKSEGEGRVRRTDGAGAGSARGARIGGSQGGRGGDPAAGAGGALLAWSVAGPGAGPWSSPARGRAPCVALCGPPLPAGSSARGRVARSGVACGRGRSVGVAVARRPVACRSWWRGAALGAPCSRLSAGLSVFPWGGARLAALAVRARRGGPVAAFRVSRSWCGCVFSASPRRGRGRRLRSCVGALGLGAARCVAVCLLFAVCARSGSRRLSRRLARCLRVGRRGVRGGALVGRSASARSRAARRCVSRVLLSPLFARRLGGLAGGYSGAVCGAVRAPRWCRGWPFRSASRPRPRWAGSWPAAAGGVVRPRAGRAGAPASRAGSALCALLGGRAWVAALWPVARCSRGLVPRGGAAAPWPAPRRAGGSPRWLGRGRSRPSRGRAPRRRLRVSIGPTAVWLRGRVVVAASGPSVRAARVWARCRCARGPSPGVRR